MTADGHGLEHSPLEPMSRRRDRGWPDELDHQTAEMNPTAKAPRRWRTTTAGSGRAALAAVALAIAATALLGLLLGAPAASAAVPLCAGAGSGAGQCSSPQGVATDFETERAYVADRGNHRVSVFEADGDFLFAFGWDVVPAGGTGLETCTTASTCKAGSPGAGAGQFTSPSQIAIDNSGGPNQGDVYVGTDNFRAQRFKEDGSFAVAFGSQGSGECQFSGTTNSLSVAGGILFVADNSGSEPNFTDRVQKFSPAGACLDEDVLLVGNFRLKSLVVNDEEDAFVSVGGAEGEPRKYDLRTGAKVCDLEASAPQQTNALALDEEGHLFANQRERWANGFSTFLVVTEFSPDPACNPIAHRFGYGQIQNDLVGLAALHTPGGDLFASEGNNKGIDYLAIPGPGPIVAPPSLEANPVGNTKATAIAEINPEGKATSYRVDYVTEAAYLADKGAGGDGFEGSETKSTTTQPQTSTAARTRNAAARRTRRSPRPSPKSSSAAI